MDEQHSHVVFFSSDPDPSFGDIDAGASVVVSLKDEPIRVAVKGFPQLGAFAEVEVLLEGSEIALSPEGVFVLVGDDVWLCLVVPIVECR